MPVRVSKPARLSMLMPKKFTSMEERKLWIIICMTIRDYH